MFFDWRLFRSIIAVDVFMLYPLRGCKAVLQYIFVKFFDIEADRVCGDIVV